MSAPLKEQEVSSFYSPVEFGGVVVPVGYLGSFRRKKHLACEPGQGWVLEVLPGGRRRNRLCPCATGRAILCYRQVGATEFLARSKTWEQSARDEDAMKQKRERNVPS